MNIKVNTSTSGVKDTSKNPAQQGGVKLKELLAEAKDHSVLLMLSGGSAFKLLEGLEVSDFHNVTITVLDERFSADEKINNFAQLMKTEFYTKALDAGASFIDTRIVDGETLNEAEVRFDYALKSWIYDNPGGNVIATMGIGLDGHTAGIFPHADTEKFLYLFEQEERLVTAYNTLQSEHHERITVTNHFLREYVDQAVVYAVGEEKRAALEALLKETGDLTQTPTRIMMEMKEVMLFTDIKI